MGDVDNKNVAVSTRNLNFCVTRWAVRANSLCNMLKNDITLVLLFCTCMSNNK